MGSIGWYVFRTTMVAFLITLVSLTVVIWFTQAMRDFDLITSQRQTLFVFVGITGLIIPLLVMMMAPIALVMAAAHVLNKLSTDSEIIVMNAAGMSPWRLLWPFLAAAIVVSILVGGIAAYVSPLSLRELRDWGAQVRADILTNIVQPGRFTTVSGNLTFHIADRRPDGLLVGIFVDDGRDPKEHSTYLAERRRDREQRKRLVPGHGRRQRAARHRRRARPAHHRLRPLCFRPVEIHRRSAERHLYGAREVYLGAAVAAARRRALPVTARPIPLRTARSPGDAALSVGLHHRGLHLSWAAADHPAKPDAGAARHVGVVALLRLVGFVSVIVGVRVPGMLSVQYIALIGSMIAGVWQISRGLAIEPALMVSKIATAIGERIARATS